MSSATGAESEKGPETAHPNTTKFIARSAELKSMYSSRFPYDF
jgi:hypothetical protein